MIRNPYIIWRLITDYYNLYTIQLTAWTDAFGFDPRVSAKSYVRPGHNVTVALRTAHPRWRFESSCPTSENGPHFPRSGPITDWTDTSPLPKS